MVHQQLWVLWKPPHANSLFLQSVELIKLSGRAGQLLHPSPGNVDHQGPSCPHRLQGLTSAVITFLSHFFWNFTLMLTPRQLLFSRSNVSYVYAFVGTLYEAETDLRNGVRLTKMNFKGVVNYFVKQLRPYRCTNYLFD